MLNLNTYDAVEPKQSSTWIDKGYKLLYSTAIPKYKYYCFLNRFNPANNITYYFICFSNVPIPNNKNYTVGITKGGYIKINMEPIWTKCNLDRLKDDTINIELYDRDNDSSIYYLDV